MAQNTQGVRSFVALEPGFVAEQIDAVLDDVHIDAVKIGMIANAAIAEAVADCLRRHKVSNIVLDPVMVAKSGHSLLDPDAVAAVREVLVPISTLITPNLPEASVLLEREGEWTAGSMDAALKDLRNLGSEWVLLKGGHLSDSAESTDLLAGADGTTGFPAPRIVTTNDHGTGCTLSAAIAALLPRHGMIESVGTAKAYLHQALEKGKALDVGHGHGPVHHFHALWGVQPEA